MLGLTTSGVVKVWTVSAQDLNNSGEPVLEHESKQIRCLNATSMTCCLYNQRTVIIVSPKNWQVNIKRKHMPKLFLSVMRSISIFETTVSVTTHFCMQTRFMMLVISHCCAPCHQNKANHGLAEIFWLLTALLYGMLQELPSSTDYQPSNFSCFSRNYL